VITVLRLGHRPTRDKRVTTHVALTARAFGAARVLVDTRDEALEKTIRDLVRRFGGPFEIETGVSWRRVLREFSGTKVHLTMYGLHLDEVLPKIPRDDLLIVVGAEKVPADLFRIADYNVAVGNQPHSEVAALAVFLDRLLDRSGLRQEFRGRLRIRPSPRGKAVVDEPS
jgi:tRNA (cytidine56-2'-O)-methyltransferase